MKNSDIEVLKLMLVHCNDINDAIAIFGDDINTFISNRVYQHAVIDCLLQLGELTTHLSDNFKAETSDDIDWIGLKVFRNISAHRYGTLKFDQTWNTMHVFLPVFVEFCENHIQMEDDNNECVDDLDDEWDL